MAKPLLDSLRSLRERVQRAGRYGLAVVLAIPPICPFCGWAAPVPASRLGSLLCRGCGERYQCVSATPAEVESPDVVTKEPLFLTIEANGNAERNNAQQDEPIQEDTRAWAEQVLNDYEARVACSRLARQIQDGTEAHHEDLYLLAQVAAGSSSSPA